MGSHKYLLNQAEFETINQYNTKLITFRCQVECGVFSSGMQNFCTMGQSHQKTVSWDIYSVKCVNNLKLKKNLVGLKGLLTEFGPQCFYCLKIRH